MRSPQSSLAGRGALGSIILPRADLMGEENKAQSRPETTDLSSFQILKAACVHPSPRGPQISDPPSGQGRLFPRSQPEWKGKTNRLCLVSIESTRRLTAEVSVTHSINHRLNVITRAGQVVKRGLQVAVTASYLKIWSRETERQVDGYLAHVHQPFSSPFPPPFGVPNPAPP